ncbi:hypothetical protein BD311DRAFT_771849 [Dichomitus squalens]|uniref:Uncharacterized protein n=1 Tax=Dichomitus squalens TaxID=114155 RepID=A0A4Q9M7K7_9APHY|nr:hypothetical protein BD311DRAFT_771849 [Dichomitus squalens]
MSNSTAWLLLALELDRRCHQYRKSDLQMRTRVCQCGTSQGSSRGPRHGKACCPQQDRLPRTNSARFLDSCHQMTLKIA